MITAMVCGTARSGTSMTCGILECLGFRVSTETPTERQLIHNPKGMYEIAGIMGVAAKFEEQVKPLSLLPEPDFTAAKESLAPFVSEFLQQHQPTDTDLWAFKGPGMYCLDILPDFLQSPHLIVVMRNPVDTAKSFQIMRQLDNGVRTPINCLIPEVAFNQMILARSAKRCSHPVHYTTYESIKRNPWEEARKMAEFLSITSTKEMKQKVLEFIEPDLCTWVEVDGEAHPKDN